MADAAKKPDYTLGVINKDTERRGYVGAGWKNQDGSITITINPCVVLSGNDALALRLFPVFPAKAGQTAVAAAVSGDDIPF